jgi:hypothetical protein
VCTPLFSLTHMQKPCHIWAGQESPSIQLLAAKQDLALGQAQPLIAPVRVRAGDGDESPLLILDFLTKRIVQATPSAGSLNNISVTLVTRAGIRPGSLLVISGLTGAATPDSQHLPVAVGVSGTQNVSISGSAQVFAANGTGEWNKEAGRLAVAISGHVLPNVTYTLDFTLQNPQHGQRPPSVYVEVTGSSSVPKTEMETGTGNGAPLGVARFLAQMGQNASIGQSVPYPLALNTLTVTIGLETQITDRESRVTLSGLTGTFTPSGALHVRHIVDAENTDPAMPLHSPFFHATIGTLEFTFNASLQPLVPYLFSFQVRNQAAAQESPLISIELSGSIALVRRRIRSATGSSAPLLISGFSVRNISQLTSTPGAINTIFVTLAPSIDWEISQCSGRGQGSCRALVGFLGLVGSQTTDTETLAILETSSPRVLVPSGKSSMHDAACHECVCVVCCACAGLSAWLSGYQIITHQISHLTQTDPRILEAGGREPVVAAVAQCHPSQTQARHIFVPTPQPNVCPLTVSGVFVGPQPLTGPVWRQPYTCEHDYHGLGSSIANHGCKLPHRGDFAIHNCAERPHLPRIQHVLLLLHLSGKQRGGMSFRLQAQHNHSEFCLKSGSCSSPEVPTTLSCSVTTSQVSVRTCWSCFLHLELCPLLPHGDCSLAPLTHSLPPLSPHRPVHSLQFLNSSCDMVREPGATLGLTPQHLGLGGLSRRTRRVDVVSRCPLESDPSFAHG